MGKPRSGKTWALVSTPHFPCLARNGQNGQALVWQDMASSEHFIFSMFGMARLGEAGAGKSRPDKARALVSTWYFSMRGRGA